MPKQAAAPILPSADTAIPLITEVAEYMAALQPVREIETALAERERRLAAMLARRRGEQSKKTAAERGLALVKGGRLAGIPTDAEVETAHEEIALLRQALIEKHAVLDAVANKLSVAESKAVKPLFDAYMADALQGMRQMAAAFRGATELAAALYRAGYTPSAMTLPDLTPSGARLLGDPAVQGSESWYFAKTVQTRKETK